MYVYCRMDRSELLEKCKMLLFKGQAETRENSLTWLAKNIYRGINEYTAIGNFEIILKHINNGFVDRVGHTDYEYVFIFPTKFVPCLFIVVKKGVILFH